MRCSSTTVCSNIDLYEEQLMAAKVFIGGSRAVSRLNKVIRDQLDKTMQLHCPVLIGDANGVDKAVQMYLFERNYKPVTVFCMDASRNNIGSWPERVLSAPSTVRGFDYYTMKDQIMAQEASCGIMLWDGVSRGTFTNMINLLQDNKKVLVYFSPKKAFHKLNFFEDLKELLAMCDENEAHRLVRQFNTSLRNVDPGLPLFTP